MTNYGAIAILAALPEDAPARQLRLLIALETFRAEEGGWRPVGQVLLASTANFSRRTLQRARPELIAARLIAYQPGQGRGVLSRYRIEIPDLKRGPAGAPFSGDVKGRTEAAKRAQVPPVKGRTGETAISPVPAGQAPVLNGDGPHAALGAKAPALKAGSFSSPGSDAAPRGAAHSQGQGRDRRWYRLCDVDAPSRHSEACRRGDRKDCRVSWCECRCHGHATP